MWTASQPHTSSHRRQPVHFFSSTVLTPKKSSMRSVCCRLSASKGQMLMHSSQPEPMHFSSITTAFGHSFFLIDFVTSPTASRIASGGQTTPQAPQSMQSVGSMTCNSFREPVMAFVGQRFVQAVQPIHVSMML